MKEALTKTGSMELLLPSASQGVLHHVSSPLQKTPEKLKY